MSENERKIEKIDPKNKKGLSKEKLEEILKGWQDKLSMKDWDIAIEIVDFKRIDYKQSGDFRADPKTKTGTILITWNPFRVEELTILHELIHIMLWDYDQATEKIILKKYKEFGKEHIEYLEKVEDLVDHLTKVFTE